MQYMEIPEWPREQILKALESGRNEEMAIALLSAALFSCDQEWATMLCLKFTGADSECRYAAVLGLAHLARRFGSIDTELVLPRLRELLNDPAIRGVAEVALDDIDTFCH